MMLKPVFDARSHCSVLMGSGVLLKPDLHVNHFFLGLLVMPRKPSLWIMPKGAFTHPELPTQFLP